MIKELKKFGKVIEDADLSDYNTLQLNSRVKYLCFPDSVADLRELLAYIKKVDTKYLIIGNGSNIVLKDDYYDGVFIKLSELCNVEVHECLDIVYVEAGALLPNIVAECVNRNKKGLEFAAGIPGTLGGAIYGNAGAYNSCIMNFVTNVIVLDEELKTKKIPKAEIKYDYRYTSFKEQKELIILAAELALLPGTKEDSMALMADRLNRRRESQPLEYPSAGSVFRNPANDFAGRLIEASGLKGHTIGGAKVSEKHANFIINFDHAKSSDVYQLITKVQETVLAKEKVNLQIEQEFISWE